MNKLIRNLPAGLALIAALVGGSLNAGAQQPMTVVLSGKYMLTGSSAVIEVIDRNCGDRVAGRWTLAGNQEIPISVCGNNAGYANIATRNVSINGDWHGSSLLHNGEAVYP